MTIDAISHKVDLYNILIKTKANATQIKSIDYFFKCFNAYDYPSLSRTIVIRTRNYVLLSIVRCCVVQYERELKPKAFDGITSLIKTSLMKRVSEKVPQHRFILRQYTEGEMNLLKPLTVSTL